MEASTPGMSFESPIYGLEARLEKLKQVGRREAEEEIRRLAERLHEELNTA